MFCHHQKILKSKTMKWKCILDYVIAKSFWSNNVLLEKERTKGAREFSSLFMCSCFLIRVWLEQKPGWKSETVHTSSKSLINPRSGEAAPFIATPDLLSVRKQKRFLKHSSKDRMLYPEDARRCASRALMHMVLVCLNLHQAAFKEYLDVVSKFSSPIWADF